MSSRLTTLIMLPVALMILGGAVAKDLPSRTPESALADKDRPISAEADPANPAAVVPTVPYRSAWADYRPFKVEKPAWNPSDAEGSGASPAESAAEHNMPAMPAHSAASMGARSEDSARASSDSTASASASDTRGVIQALMIPEAKVKLKHGPLAKLGMPPMTMVYRVQDPRLLEQVKVGDEVGVTVEQVGNAFVITGFQK